MTEKKNTGMSPFPQMAERMNRHPRIIKQEAAVRQRFIPLKTIEKCNRNFFQKPFQAGKAAATGIHIYKNPGRVLGKHIPDIILLAGKHRDRDSSGGADGGKQPLVIMIHELRQNRRHDTDYKTSAFGGIRNKKPASGTACQKSLFLQNDRRLMHYHRADLEAFAKHSHGRQFIPRSKTP